MENVLKIQLTQMEVGLRVISNDIFVCLDLVLLKSDASGNFIYVTQSFGFG